MLKRMYDLLKFNFSNVALTSVKHFLTSAQKQMQKGNKGYNHFKILTFFLKKKKGFLNTDFRAPGFRRQNAFYKMNFHNFTNTLI